jgi:hypothetical protein
MTFKSARRAIFGRIRAAGAVVLVALAATFASSAPAASASGMTSCPSGSTMMTLSQVPSSEYGEASGADQNNNGVVCRSSYNWFFYEWYWYGDDS